MMSSIQQPIELDKLYQEILREHYKDPRNFGTMTDPDLRGEGYNPLCGDRISLELKLNEKRDMITHIRFHGEGCSICIASTSMMTEEAEGQSFTALLNKIQDFRMAMQGEVSKIHGDLESLLGVRDFPVRIKCALLPWTTLKDTLKNFKELTSHEIKEWLKPICDPEIRISLVDLGLIYRIDLSEEKGVLLEMSLTSPGCPVAGMIVQEVKKRLLSHPQVEKADVKLVWEPKWDPKTMATEEGKEALGLW